MLKKLVKYGNSTALVLDKAILELLNITEGAIVKIKTDGVSLTITPQDAAKTEHVTPTITSQETHVSVGQDLLKKNLEKWGATQEEWSNMGTTMQEIQNRYEGALRKFMVSSACEQELEALLEKHSGNKFSPEFTQAVNNIKYTYAPELIEYDKEMQAALAKISQNPDSAQERATTFSASFNAFQPIFKKYTPYTQKLTKLMAEDVDFQQESLLLAEKYQAQQNSLEYMQAFQALKNKYVPELIEMDKEIAEVGKMAELSNSKN